MNQYTLEDYAQVLCVVCDTMNARINEIGQIPTSDLTIKTWHTYTNADWEITLQAVIEIDKVYNVPSGLVRDVKALQAHIAHFGYLSNNILYPTVAETKQLPKRATEVAIYQPARSVKSITFRAMMNIRELYCDIIGLDLPNEDSSIGKLQPTPTESLFEFQ